MFNTALMLTNNVEDAKDLVQDTFLRAYRSCDRYNLGSNIHGWLFKIMKNIFINNFRKKKRQPAMMEYSEIEPYVQNIGLNRDMTEEDHNTILHNSLSDEVSHALSKLSDEYKFVLILRVLKEFSYKEIAEILDIPIGTVRSRLSRARRAMYNSLSKSAKNGSNIFENTVA